MLSDQIVGAAGDFPTVQFVVLVLPLSFLIELILVSILVLQVSRLYICVYVICNYMTTIQVTTDCNAIV